MEKAAEVEEIDVIFPIINRLGIGIIGGTKEDMLHAIKKAEKARKGLFAMKAQIHKGHLSSKPSAYKYKEKEIGIA